ncbi:MAG: DUF4384 domain-containing protein [Bacteroidaceae bacterium]|jgi:hypothetical protein|nr:DUF4384 domain-containing protein [Bacteroidaceae bacterium]
MKRNYYIFIFIAVFSLAVLPLSAREKKKGKPEELPPYTGTYWIESFSSLKDAEAKAVTEAVNDALINRYGVFTDTKTTTNVVEINGEGKTEFVSTGVSRLRGELVKILEAGNFQHKFVDNKLQITVTVRILAREKNTSDIDLLCKLLRNKDDKSETLKYYDGEDIYFYFRSPVDGYLAVYLEDENQFVYNLLPYQDDPEGSIYITHNKNYLFFCDDKKYFAAHDDIVPPTDFSMVTGLYLTCSEGTVNNKLYVLFSPNPFVRSNANSSDSLPYLSLLEFQNWLGKCRMDEEFMDLSKLIIISARKND